MLFSKQKLVYILILTGLLVGGLFLLIKSTTTFLFSSPAPVKSSPVKNITFLDPNRNKPIVKNIFQASFTLRGVPFTSQAPFGNWQDSREQNGCEETAALMAVRWAEGGGLTPLEAEKEIIAISDYEEKNYGEFRDSSVKDTVERIFKGYFHYDNAEAVYNINLGDITNELVKGNLVIVPVNGRKLRNPFYVFPGPIEHNIVIIGYDPLTKEFIADDPGTKHGEKYRYPEEVLDKALQDYPTGFHKPISKIVKAMIVVKKPNN